MIEVHRYVVKLGARPSEGMGKSFVHYGEKPEREYLAVYPSLVPRAADVGSVEAVVAALYEVISGPAGQKRDWDRLRSLFLGGARLAAAGSAAEGGARVMGVESYIAMAGPLIEANGYFEHEIARRVETFGHIAQVFSAYEARHLAEDDAPFTRGVNSIQLIHDGARWWIAGIVWQSEDAANPLPQELRASNPPA